jgi:polyhydroxyalkanoate synthase
LGQAQFGVIDVLRRAQGEAFAALALHPSETPHQIISSGPFWRLRDYGGREGAPALLVIAAPIKRPYIWDLTPSVSAIRHCLRQDLHPYLLEWMPASHHTSGNGLDEHALAISDCIAKIARRKTPKPALIGHSLGGTLAAIYSAVEPESVRRLVLLSAPLCFRPGSCEFRDALVSLTPTPISHAEPFPGSLLSQMSAMASPGTFVWSRLIDAVVSVADVQAMEIHRHVERWALDESPLPGKLVQQMIEWLYHEDRFCRGTLEVTEKSCGPSGITIPTFAMVNTADAVAPLASVKPFVDALPGPARILAYSGETGVCLQHLAILVGRKARAHVWPEIVGWLKS